MRGNDIIEYWYYFIVFILIFLLVEMLIFFEFNDVIEILNFAILFVVLVITSFMPKFYVLSRRQQADRLTSAYYDLIKIKDKQIDDLKRDKDIVVSAAIRGEKRRKKPK